MSPGCILVKRGGTLMAVCQAMGAAVHGQPCVQSADCLPGHFCDVDGTLTGRRRVCVELCDTRLPSTCSTDTACNQIPFSPPGLGACPL